MKKLLYPECILFYVVLAFFIFGNWIVNGIVYVFKYFGMVEKSGVIINPAKAIHVQTYSWMMKLSLLLLIICVVLSIWRRFRRTG